MFKSYNRLHRLLVLMMALSAVPCMADTLPDIGLSTQSWNLCTGATIENGILTIDGHADAYRRVNIEVPATAFGHTKFYFTVEVRLKNIVPGTAIYSRPKIKVYQDGSKAYLARNIIGLPENRWSLVTLEYEITSQQNPQTLTFELGIQQCEGQVEFKNPMVLPQAPVSTFEYPFDRPDNPNCSLDINTSKLTPMNNHLLGANQQFAGSPIKYGDSSIDDLIRSIDLPQLRFPGGTVSNFYDWQTDGFFMPDPYTGRLKTWIGNLIDKDDKFEFQAYANLCQTNQIASQLVFNVLKDTVEESVSRLQNRQQAGLTFEYIELGNENYSSAQQGGRIEDQAAYISFTQQLNDALKAADPSIKTAVMSDGNMMDWDQELAGCNYYDAVVMHPYLRVDTTVCDDETISLLLSAYKIFNEDVQHYTDLFGNRDLLLSEWGIIGMRSDNEAMNNIYTALSVADKFLAILKQSQEGPVRQALIHILISTKETPEAQSLFNCNRVTGERFQSRRGVVYRNIIHTFKDSQVYLAQSTSPQLTTDLPATIARAVKRSDGKKVVFAVNKLDVACPLELKIDGVVHTGTYTLKTYTEPQLTGYGWYPFDQDVMAVQQGTGGIQLPPLSISVIELD